jgi:hypothetical protein
MEKRLNGIGKGDITPISMNMGGMNWLEVLLAELGMPREEGYARMEDMLRVGRTLAERVRDFIERRPEVKYTDMIACLIPWGVWADAYKEGMCSESFLSWLEGLDLEVVARRVREEYVGEDEVISEEWRKAVSQAARYMAEDWVLVRREVKRKAHILALVEGQAKMWLRMTRRAMIKDDGFWNPRCFLEGVQFALDRWTAWRTWGVLERCIKKEGRKRRRVWRYGLYTSVI